VLCKAGRYTLLDEKRDRVTQPLVRKNGQLVAASWEEALSAAAQGLKTAPMQAVVSSRLSVEALYAFKQLAGGLGAQAGALPDREVTPIPPFLGEHIGANLGASPLLSKHSIGDDSWAEPYTVRAGANTQALKVLGVGAAPAALNGAVLVALGDDQATPELVQSLADARCVVVLASYGSALTERADVVLPVENWAEQQGHYLNMIGRLQKTAAVLKAAPEVRSNLAALNGLAQKCAVELSGDWETAIKVTA
jgi:NADH dehydrogenase/NADH:ubiquinone oxidoreductase subunit G